MVEIKKAAIYARVSTQEQTVEQQFVNCRKYCVAQEWAYDEYAEVGVSGSKTSRTELDRMLQRMRAGEYQAVVVWKLDRLGRSTIHLLQLLEEFRNRGVQLLVTTMGLNTDRPEGRFFFSVIAAFAELEREFIKQRVQASIDTKRANGIRLGRPPGAKDKRPRRKSGYYAAIARKPRKGQSWYQKEKEVEATEAKLSPETPPPIAPEGQPQA
jgi:DNA invertase Pin-like site-specific DNA recombinase